MRAPSAPATPDPYRVARAQQMASVDVAIANTWLDNADEERPDGGVTYVSTGTQTVGGISVPRFKRTTTLTAAGQTAFDQQEDITVAFNIWALAQIGILTETQAAPLSTDGLSSRTPVPTTPSVDVTSLSASPLVMSIGDTDLTGHLADIRDALGSRVEWQIGIDRDLRRAELAAMGIVPGMTAYDNEMRAFEYTVTDARLRTLIEAGKEQSRIVFLEEHVGQFANGAVKDKWMLDNEAIERLNARKEQKYRLGRDACEYVDMLRQHELQEVMAVRSSNVNEISALINGGMVTVPQFQPFTSGHISDAPIAQSVYQSAAMDMNKWQQRVERQNQIISGVMGMTGNIVGAGLAKGGGLTTLLGG